MGGRNHVIKRNYESLPNEIWKEHKIYDVSLSNFGRLRHPPPVRSKTLPGHITKGHRNRRSGKKETYDYVVHCKYRDTRKSASRRVHVLILEAFGFVKKDGDVCDHIDGNSENNLLENLEFVSPEENQHRRRAMEKLNKK